MSEHLDKVVAQVLKDPKIQQIVRDARLFDGLKENEGWRRLHQMVAAKRENWMKGVLIRFMGPKKNWPEPEEIAYHKGFYDGAVYVLAHPEHAEASLERAAKLAWVMSQEIEEEETLA